MADVRTAFHLQRIETRLGPLALLTMDNGEDHTKPTVLGRSAIESGQRALDAIEAGEWAALVVTGKPFVFAAGADIDEFPRVRSREEAIAGSRAGHDLFARLRELPFPTVAAVNGVCLGGGLEVALHCDARTIASSVRHFGAPECFLGIIPAWGGTQLVPRLAGVQVAVRVIVENADAPEPDAARGQEAIELGLADRMLDAGRVPRRVDRLRARARRPGRRAARPSRPERRRRGRRPRPRTARRVAPRRRARSLPRARPDRRRRELEPRGGLPRRGGGSRPISCSRRRRARRCTPSTSSSAARRRRPGIPQTSRRAASARSASSARG